MATERPDRTDGRASRWEQHKLERRSRILDAALEVIEEEPPGADVHVQQIADRAGLGRTVVYRHFADRADLDRHIRTRALERLQDALRPEVSLDGTINEIILGLVRTYVRWAVEHPSLHWYAEQEPANEGQGGASPLAQAAAAISRQVVELFAVGAQLTSVPIDKDTEDSLEPMVFGIVGQVHITVRAWLHRSERRPSPEVLAEQLSRSIWFQVDGHARLRGATLEPDTPLDQIVSEALANLS